MAPSSNSIHVEPHRSLLKALIETKKAAAQTNTNQLDKDIIGTFLLALCQLNVFNKNPTKQTWKVVESVFHDLHHSIYKCRKLKGHQFIKSLVRLKNVILNNYNWPCIHPVKIHRAILDLESMIQGFVSRENSNISKLEVESAFIFEKNVSKLIPKTNNADIVHDTKKEKEDTTELVIDLNSSSNPKEDSWPHKNQTPECVCVSKLLNEQCKAFIQSKESIELGVADKLKLFESIKKSAVEKQLLKDIEHEIHEIFSRKSKLYVYGSHATGLATTDSDLDIYCDVTGNNYKRGLTNKKQKTYNYVRGLTYKAQKTYMTELGERLPENNDKFSEIKCLYSSYSVPTVRLFHKPTGIHCDISSKDCTSVENTKLLKVYMDLDPRVHWLLTAMKMWAQYNEIIGPKYFTSYGLTWLILFYLMQVKVVPPVQQLQNACTRKVIRYWNVAFKKPRSWKSKVEMSAMDLFIGFFSWIVTTDLTSSCLCTATGEMIPKYVFEDVSLMKEYGDGVFREYAKRLEVEKARKYWHVQRIIMNGADGLCVQDPFEYCMNVVQNVTDENYCVFLKLCRITNQFFV